MKTDKERTRPESKKRDYTKPEIKKREQIKEVAEGLLVVVTPVKTG